MATKKRIRAVIIWPSGSVIQDYGSANPGLKEIFTDPRHWTEQLNFLFYCRIDETNAEAHKWYAIALGSRGEFGGVK
jgi:hypothetical protein